MKSNQCISCGASMGANTAKCEYCHATYRLEKNDDLVIEGRSCPACSTLNSIQAKYCSSCAKALLEACKECGKSIPCGSQHCFFCGSVHHGSKIDEKKRIDFSEAMNFQNTGDFAEADRLFHKLEKTKQATDEFYAAWIQNYVFWGMSFDNDKTMHDFSRQYRLKAEDLLKIAELKFPNNISIEKAKNFLLSNSEIKIKKKACFVATEVYGDAMCDEVEVLRCWRDRFLNKHRIGRQFIQWYYRRGPKMAQFIKHYPFLKSLVKPIISGHIYFIRFMNNIGKKDSLN